MTIIQLIDAPVLWLATVAALPIVGLVVTWRAER